jgi:hypothetical protein
VAFLAQSYHAVMQIKVVALTTQPELCLEKAKAI